MTIAYILNLSLYQEEKRAKQNTKTKPKTPLPYGLITRLSPEKKRSVSCECHFNWFSFQISSLIAITTSSVNDLSFWIVLEEFIYFGIDKTKLLAVILITLRKRAKKTVRINRWHSICFRRKSEKKRVNEKLNEQIKTKRKHLKKTFHLSHLIEIPAVDNETWNWCLKSCKWNFDWEQCIDDKIKLVRCEKWQRRSNLKRYFHLNDSKLLLLL